MKWVVSSLVMVGAVVADAEKDITRALDVQFNWPTKSVKVTFDGYEGIDGADCKEACPGVPTDVSRIDTLQGFIEWYRFVTQCPEVGKKCEPLFALEVVQPVKKFQYPQDAYGMDMGVSLAHWSLKVDLNRVYFPASHEDKADWFDSMDRAVALTANFPRAIQDRGTEVQYTPSAALREKILTQEGTEFPVKTIRGVKTITYNAQTLYPVGGRTDVQDNRWINGTVKISGHGVDLGRGEGVIAYVLTRERHDWPAFITSDLEGRATKTTTKPTTTQSTTTKSTTTQTTTCSTEPAGQKKKFRKVCGPVKPKTPIRSGIKVIPKLPGQGN